MKTTKPFNYEAHCAELEAGIPAAVEGLRNALSNPSVCAAETFEQTAEAFAYTAEVNGDAVAVATLLRTLLAAVEAKPSVRDFNA